MDFTTSTTNKGMGLVKFNTKISGLIFCKPIIYILFRTEKPPWG